MGLHQPNLSFWSFFVVSQTKAPLIVNVDYARAGTVGWPCRLLGSRCHCRRTLKHVISRTKQVIRTDAERIRCSNPTKSHTNLCGPIFAHTDVFGHNHKVYISRENRKIDITTPPIGFFLVFQLGIVRRSQDHPTKMKWSKSVLVRPRCNASTKVQVSKPKTVKFILQKLTFSKKKWGQFSQHSQGYSAKTKSSKSVNIRSRYVHSHVNIKKLYFWSGHSLYSGAQMNHGVLRTGSLLIFPRELIQPAKTYQKSACILGLLWELWLIQCPKPEIKNRIRDV